MEKIPDSPPPSAPQSAKGLLTDSGVIVAVTEQTLDGFLVVTPCGNEATLLRGEPIGKVDVVIDPGHGGAPDPGAVSTNGLSEAVINLRVAEAVKTILTERGFSVALTRTSDYSSPLSVRAALADQLEAEIMVSIHHNAPTANLGSIPGTEVFVQHGQSDSRRLGELVYRFVTEGLGAFEGMTWSAAPDAGAIEVLNTRGSDAYGILRTPDIVTVLAELAYISHREEADLMRSAKYLATVGTALSDAIETYLTTGTSGFGYVDTPRVFNPQRGLSPAFCEDPIWDENAPIADVDSTYRSP